MSRTFRLCALAVLLVTCAVTLHLLRMDARALLWLQESRATAEQRASGLWLPGYQAVLQIEVPGFEKEEFSDLSYNPATDTLFTVSGKQPLLIELSLDGQLLRSIPIFGASNLEGVAVLEDGYLAVTDERQHNLTIFKLDANTRELRTEQAVQQVDLGYSDSANKGFEGLAWDKRNQRLLLGKEKNPMLLFGLSSDGRKVTGELQELAPLDAHMTDLAALTVDPRSGQILALSQESHLLVSLNQQYQPQSFIALLGGLNGLDHYIPQAEGVALDGVGNLYMVSERNKFYAFRQEPAAQ
ncbi:MAG: SdiA-regulated domain-containing protein [Pseudomonas sp.]|uniref:SdiA-regulated domain-containing protein n=1 Tax=Pseudomonas sp. TaxID=306 RepID=UPI0027367955|nr:SdiA-regulated domain-containing protein [Pseudomonas sp.]MDP3848743.1 SdiA-regulated domain-containing protein [Pseudomonas sp.]